MVCKVSQAICRSFHVFLFALGKCFSCFALPEFESVQTVRTASSKIELVAQFLTIFTKSSNLDVAGVLDLTLYRHFNLQN